MIVAFYSDSRGNAGTTSNLCLVAAYLAMVQNEKILLWENHFNWNRIGANIKEHMKYDRIREEVLSYELAPLKEIFTMINKKAMSRVDLFMQAQEIYNKRLFYLENREQNEMVFEKELIKVLKDFVGLLRQSEGHVFIDVADPTKESTKLILKQADVIVCNLCQDSRSLDQVLFQPLKAEMLPIEQNDLLFKKKACFLIGKYDSRAKNSIKQIVKRYQIDSARISVIPYNTEFKDAMEFGRILPFLSTNMNCEKEDENYYFMKKVCEGVRMIMRGGVDTVCKEEERSNR